MSRLRVAVIHYHLKRGGVTRVIESTLGGLQSCSAGEVDVVVIAGEIPEVYRYPEKAVRVAGLTYSNLQESTPPPVALLKDMRAAARAYFGTDPDIWHIHNHSLGKNSSMPGVVSLLVREGHRVLLHMHDFAEDGRPENYLLNKTNPEFADALYPDAENAHYGFINSRDREIFRKSGVPGSRLHYLANPVGGKPHSEIPKAASVIRSQLGARRLFLYPVRAVRRKNLGEMLLWSAMADKGDVFATTLGPTNPIFHQAYDAWIAFARDHGLPVRFAIGETGHWDFPDIVQAADFILTTSIAEGFGLTFLEPSLFRKLILGRNLPDVTVDFTESGLPTGQLYTRLPVPLGWIDREYLVSQLRKDLVSAYRAYGAVPPHDVVDQAMAAIACPHDCIDFGGLDEFLQKSIIRRIVEDPAARGHLQCTPLVPEPLPPADDLNLEAFSVENYTSRLLSTYRTIASSGSASNGSFDGDLILMQFLKPSRFRLLRT